MHAVKWLPTACLLAGAVDLTCAAENLPQAGNFPDRPIRLIVPVTVGGSTDIVARIIAVSLARELNQQFVIDNRSGAGGIIGSDVVEAGCKTVIGSRCKQSGMFWSQTGAENILALRCIHSSRRIQDFWQFRLDQHAARNAHQSFAA